MFCWTHKSRTGSMNRRSVLSTQNRVSLRSIECDPKPNASPNSNYLPYGVAPFLLSSSNYLSSSFSFLFSGSLLLQLFSWFIILSPDLSSILLLSHALSLSSSCSFFLVLLFFLLISWFISLPVSFFFFHSISFVPPSQSLIVLCFLSLIIFLFSLSFFSISNFHSLYFTFLRHAHRFRFLMKYLV